MTVLRRDRANDFGWDDALRGRCVALLWEGPR